MKPGTRVSARGAIRRIRALQAIGYRVSDVAEVAGMNRPHLGEICRGQFDSVTIRTHVRIDKAYRRLHMVVPNTHVADLVRRRSRRNGYEPPLAWNDIDKDEHAHAY